MNFSLLEAQTFTFDSFACYSIETKCTTYENSCFINSRNDKYFLLLFNVKGNLAATLYDSKNLKSHYYKVEEKKINGKSKFNFIFQYSNKHQTLQHPYFDNYMFDIKEIDSKEEVKKMELNVYRNSKKRKSKMNVEFEYIKMPMNLFFAYKVCCLHPFEFDENLFLNKNCLVTKGKEISVSGNNIKHKLIDYKEVDLELIVPKYQ